MALTLTDFITECIECVRRLLLASVVGLAADDSAAGAVMGLLLSLFFILVFSELRPFKAEDDFMLGIMFSYSLTLVSLALVCPSLHLYSTFA